MNARYYDPTNGRFINEDSYRGDGDSFWHLYAYCSGDPVNHTDPTGHDPGWVVALDGIGYAGTNGYNSYGYKMYKHWRGKSGRKWIIPDYELKRIYYNDRNFMYYYNTYSKKGMDYVKTYLKKGYTTATHYSGWQTTGKAATNEGFTTLNRHYFYCTVVGRRTSYSVRNRYSYNGKASITVKWQIWDRYDFDNTPLFKDLEGSYARKYIVEGAFYNYWTYSYTF